LRFSNIDGYSSPELLFNFANTQYKLGDIPEAILNFERALRLDPDDEDIEFNLQLAKLKVISKIETREEAVFLKLVNDFLNLFSVKALSWISIILIWLALAAGLLFIFGKQIKVRRVGFFTMIVFLILFLFSFTLAALKNHQLENRSEAILMSTNTYIKSAPDDSSTDLFILHGGVKMRILDEVNDWYKIRIADGKVGWVESSIVEKI
ncbi:MAG: SH3 domain-containing protein, partial [Chitinophagales bacterium]|nr:SH3 domain-containing protein [Chitinophagales bacterium]